MDSELEDRVNIALAGAFRLELIRRGETQDQLADAIGLTSKGTASRRLNAVKPFRPVEIYAIIEHFGWQDRTLGELFAGPTKDQIKEAADAMSERTKLEMDMATQAFERHSARALAEIKRNASA